MTLQELAEQYKDYILALEKLEKYHFDLSDDHRIKSEQIGYLIQKIRWPESDTYLEITEDPLNELLSLLDANHLSKLQREVELENCEFQYRMNQLKDMPRKNIFDMLTEK